MSDIRRRHAEYYLALAQSANLTMEAEGDQRYDIVIPDRDNLLGALEWARDSGDIDLGLELAVALTVYWVANSPLEGMGWLSELLEQAGDLPCELRARALRDYGAVTYIAGEFDQGTRQYQASLAMFRRLGDDRGVGHVLHLLAMDALRRDETEQARALQDESLRLFRKLRYRKGEALALGVFAQLELLAGNDELSFELLERSASLAAETGFVWWQAGMLLTLSELLLERGRMSESMAHVREVLPLVAQMGDRRQMIVAVALLARLAGDMGQPDQAGLLWGAIEAEEARAPIPLWELGRDRYAPPILIHAGPDFERGRYDGTRLSLSEAVEHALLTVK